MKTLNSPLFEVNQESVFYKKEKAVKDQQGRVSEILAEVANTIGCDVKEFAFYGSRGFGFKYYTEAYDKFKDQLTKNSDRNGVHTFKKTTPMYKKVSQMLVEVDKINGQKDPFSMHDIFGINNLVASQWVDGRLFYEVKDASATEKLLSSSNRSQQYPVEPVQSVDYKEYIAIALAAFDGK